MMATSSPDGQPSIITRVHGVPCCVAYVCRQSGVASEVAGLGAAMVRQRGDLARLNALLADNTGQRDALASDTASLRAEVAATCKVGGIMARRSLLPRALPGRGTGLMVLWLRTAEVVSSNKELSTILLVQVRRQDESSIAWRVLKFWP